MYFNQKPVWQNCSILNIVVFGLRKGSIFTEFHQCICHCEIMRSNLRVVQVISIAGTEAGADERVLRVPAEAAVQAAGVAVVLGSARVDLRQCSSFWSYVT